MKKKKERKKIPYKRIGIITIVCLLAATGIFWFLNRGQVSRAEEENWETLDLSKMEEPVLTDSTKNFKIATARTTFYDIYSDSQVWKWGTWPAGEYRDTVGSITDGNKKADENDGNTFTHFNYELSYSENENGVQYQNMYVENATSNVYPLYCGISWPGQSENSRWGTWTKDTTKFYGATHGWWFAAANTNQYDNKDKLISNEGTPGETYGAAAQGLVNSELDENGNITIGHGDAMRVLPYFDADYLATPYEEGKVAKGKVISNIAFPFRKGDGTTKQYMSEADKNSGVKTDANYYYFDSYLDTIQLDEANKKVTYYHGASNNNVQDTDGKNGFFPYNTSADSQAAGLNYVFGVKMEMNFNMTSNGKIKGEDIKFEFTGDDDLWVFVDGYLVLDIGGAHIPCHGSINFATKEAVVDVVKKQDAFSDTYRDSNYGTWEYNKTYKFGKTNYTDNNGKELAELLSDTTKNHTLTIFYMERGKANSNLKIKFNLPQISTLNVGSELDAGDVNPELQTDALWQACNKHNFKYTLNNYGTLTNDYDNGIVATKEPGARSQYTPIGLDAYRQKVTSKDGGTQRLRFFTFTDKNYYSMVVANTKVTLPDSTKLGLDGDGCATIDGKKYVFLGWTKDEEYRDHWEEILNDTYTGECPVLESATDITVTESADYYAVWAKKELTVTYYDEVDVDTPLGYSVTTSDTDTNVAYIGHEQIDTTQVKDRYTKQNVISYWDDTDMDTEVTNNSSITRYNWKTDETRAGFSLTGWKLEKSEEEKKNQLITTNYSPLCDVKLYADWTRTCYRAQFQVEDSEQIKTENGTNENTAEDQLWKSNIVYFPVGVSYEGYLPYMTDESNLDSFEETVDGLTYYAFTSLPIRENYAIVKWTQNDEDNSSYRTTDMIQNGKMVYRQKWKLGNSDVIFTGTWKQMTGTVTFQAGTYKEGITDNWESVKKKYTVGTTINRPNQDDIFTEHADKDTNGWEIVGWKNEDEQVSFPYTITEESVEWTAVWKRVNSKVTYHLNDETKGITGASSYEQFYKVGSKIEKLTLEGMGSAAPYDSVGSVGDNGSHTTYYVKTGGKAYVITGWKKDGELIDDDEVTEEDCEVYAVWEEVHTTLDITVNIPTLDKDEWDTTEAGTYGWKSQEYNGGTTWTKSVELVPGELFSSYLDETNGTLSNVLYSVDVKNDIDHFKEVEYNTIVYPGGNYQLDNAEAKVPYTAANHVCTLTGTLVQKEILVMFAEIEPDVASLENVTVIGYQLYSVSGEETNLPTQNGLFLDSSGIERDAKVSEREGYTFSGWSTSLTDEVITKLVPTEEKHRTILYTRWEKDNDEETNVSGNNGSDGTVDTESQTSATNTSVFSSLGLRAKSMMRLFSTTTTSSSTEQYNGAVDLVLYELHDLQTKEEGVTGSTGNAGEFYLTYDQVASFLNCFTLKSKMMLQEDAKIYSDTGAENATVDYNNMYSTTWELRDLHGYITSRIDGDHNKDLKHMPLSDTGAIYDGRVSGEEAFLFQNENDATGASYVTNVRALFTHKIKTSDIAITKKLTDTAYNVASRKGELNQEYTFNVSFYHIFGDTSDDTKQLYDGEYIKIDEDGNYVRDENDEIQKFTATDGKITIKNGETAIISGIPAMTEYTIEEEVKAGKKDRYVLATVHENGVEGLASEDKDAVNVGAEGTTVLDNSASLKDKKLSDLDTLNATYEFDGVVENSGYTYNYVATNEVLIDGLSLYIEKIIDEFYYTDDEWFNENDTYQELSGAKQTFTFNVNYTPVDTNGNPETDKAEQLQIILTFDPEPATIEKVILPSSLQTEETKKGYKMTTTIAGFDSGYYEISEDENWSWKYDLMGVYARTQTQKFGNVIYEATHETSTAEKKSGSGNKVYRCYIPGTSETIGNTTKTYNGADYQLLGISEEPSVCFVNMKATDGRENILGDTDVVPNKIIVNKEESN